MIYTYDYLEKNGRLGNQLWQIAATIGAAERNGGSALFREDWEYRPFFSVPDEYFGSYDLSETIDGGTEYFQEYHYFQNVENEIKRFFSPSEHAGNVVLEAWKRNEQLIEASGSTCCAVHVRRGDYLKYPKHFPITTSEYYTSAVDAIKKNSPDVCFVVFSDDIDWCKEHQEHFGFGDSFAVFVDGVSRPVEVDERVGQPMDWIDLFMMAQCDYHIISNSTFAWWGGYLSGNPAVIYPSRWFNSAVPNWKNWEKAMLPGWRRFKC